MIRIAIDGPGGAGKSSLAKAVAKRLGIIYVDTGALYRTIGVYMLKNGVDIKDENSVEANLSGIQIEMKFVDNKQIILLNGDEVGDEIRTPEASMAASAVSAIGCVRAFLLETQRSIADRNSVIMDGRDIGTVILPYAEVKIFLTAKPEARARRRYEELKAKGIEVEYEQVFREMEERDKNDSTREIAPCVPAEDSVLLDNSELNFEQTVEAVIEIINTTVKRRNKRGTPFYVTMHTLIAPLYRFFARVKVIGKENIPNDGGAVICCNHIGINDVFVVASVFKRQIHFLSKKEWFSVPILKTLIKALGAVKLDRSGKDVGALKNAINVVRDGKLLAIFPQGHRYPGQDPAATPIKSGAGMIAYHAHADIIPVCIRTKDAKYKFMQKVELVIGEPIKYSEFGFNNGRYDDFKRATELAFSKICELGNYSYLQGSSSKDGAKSEDN